MRYYYEKTVLLTGAGGGGMSKRHIAEQEFCQSKRMFKSTKICYTG